MKIEPKYVDYNTAKLLFEKGLFINGTSIFNYESTTLDNGDEYIEELGWTIPQEEFTDKFCVPEQWQVVEWFRINHNIDLQAICSYNDKGVRTYKMGIIFINKNNEVDTVFLRPEKDKYAFIDFDTPQQAYEEAFKYCLTKLI